MLLLACGSKRARKGTWLFGHGWAMPTGVCVRVWQEGPTLLLCVEGAPATTAMAYELQRIHEAKPLQCVGKDAGGGGHKEAMAPVIHGSLPVCVAGCQVPAVFPAGVWRQLGS